MKIPYRKKILFPFDYPSFPVNRLASGTMPVTAAVKCYPDASTLITGIHMSAHRGRMARYNVIQYLLVTQGNPARDKVLFSIA